jgi:mono/diheme cytochrome c family protein
VLEALLGIIMKLTLSVLPGVTGRCAIFALIVTALLGCSSADNGEAATLGSMAGTGNFPVGGGSSSGAANAGSGGSVSSSGTTGISQGGGSAGTQAGGSGGAPAGAGGAMLSPGEALYVLNCGVCHGVQGVGGMFAPEIQHPVRDYSTWVVRNGRAVTPFPKPMEKVASDKLTDADLALIWDYLDTPPQPTTGQALYLDYCGNCHGADGKGGPTMRPITEELGELKMQVRSGTHPGEFDMRREYMPAVSSSRISDSELQLIYDYVESL